jgi:hypothetical protein
MSFPAPTVDPRCLHKSWASAAPVQHVKKDKFADRICRPNFGKQTSKTFPSMPRQAYGIDFYGHEQGEILVAVDLCTREAILWFLANWKQENVARALLTGLVLQKGVPLSFRNDEAPEFIKGVVVAMNRYLGIEQIVVNPFLAKC